MSLTRNKQPQQKKLNAKVATAFRPNVRSRHPSHDVLRTSLPRMPFRSIVRLGSSTDLPDTVTNGGKRIECNTIQAVKNSASKRLMKQCFQRDNVLTAGWFDSNTCTAASGLTIAGECAKIGFPVVAKQIHGSRGEGNYLLNTPEELTNWLRGKTLENYIFEHFYNYNREYRLHVTAEGCFYTCRKMLKSDTPEDKRWFRNDSNSAWILETNEDFDRPTNWDKIVAESVKALRAVGLDVGAVDVRVQSGDTSKGKARKDPKFIIIEINSAPSFGDITAQKYMEQIPKILTAKRNA